MVEQPHHSGPSRLALAIQQVQDLLRQRSQQAPKPLASARSHLAKPPGDAAAEIRGLLSRDLSAAMPAGASPLAWLADQYNQVGRRMSPAGVPYPDAMDPLAPAAPLASVDPLPPLAWVDPLAPLEESAQEEPIEPAPPPQDPTDPLAGDGDQPPSRLASGDEPAPASQAKLSPRPPRRPAIQQPIPARQDLSTPPPAAMADPPPPPTPMDAPLAPAAMDAPTPPPPAAMNTAAQPAPAPDGDDEKIQDVREVVDGLVDAVNALIQLEALAHDLSQLDTQAEGQEQAAQEEGGGAGYRYREQDDFLRKKPVLLGDTIVAVHLLYTTAPDESTPLDGGKYRGVVLDGDPTDTSPTGNNLTLPEGMDVGDEVIIYHTAEDGLPTHWLVGTNEQPYAVGRYGGTATFGSGSSAVTRPIVIIDTAKAREASPSELGDGTSASATADTHYWDRNEIAGDSGKRYGDCPIKKWYESRPPFLDKSGAAPILYGFFRYDLLDADGRVNYTSAETRITINEPKDCSTV